MATWKKVIVSGSQAELAGVTGSFTGSFTGNGAGLTGVTATAIFPTTAKTDLATADQFYINDGANKYITYGNLLTDLAGTNLAVESSDSLTLASQISVTGVTASFTGSHIGTLTGTASYATAAGNAFQLNGQAASYYTNASNINAGTLANAYLPSAINVTSVSASFTGSLTGALIGTASWATNATNATTAAATTAALTAGAGLLSGGTFNGSTARTFSVDSGSMLPYYSGSIFSTVSGDITITAGGVATIGAGAVAIGTDVSGLGAGVAAALGNGAGAVGGVVLVNGALGTPSSATLTNATGLPISTGVSGLGTGVATALGTNVGSAGSVVLNGGALGTPSSGTLTNATGLPISTGVSGLGTGVATFLATPSSANLASAVTDETGTGALVFAGSPTFTGTANFAALSTTGNVTIGGDLTVNGATTTIDTTNVTIEDRFLVLNHGSGSVSPTQEGGLIVEGSTAGSGSAFYYDGDTILRWGVALGVADTTISVTANSYVVTVSGSTSNPTGNPTYGGATNGYGNMFVNTSDSSIWIYA